MKYRKLGITGLDVSEIGFGTWGLGGDTKGAIAYGPTNDQESQRALRHAVDLGVTFFDTADLYGFGHSEEVIGSALADLRSKIMIATKVGMLDAEGNQDFSPKHIRHALEQSLRRLRTDYIDLYQLHSPPISLIESNPEVIACMQELQREGKIRSFGISVRSPDEGLVAVERLGFKCLQVNFNLLDQRALDNGLFDLCLKREVGIIARTPLCFGFLTGRYSAQDKLDPTDHRNLWNVAQREKWAGAYHLFTSSLSADSVKTPIELALRFCLSFLSISTVIPGMLNATQVEENIRSCDLGGLSESELAGLIDIYRENNFFVGS
jgi:aryl-alcohol dehydrogenase-like predicted oxidoreductase